RNENKGFHHLWSLLAELQLERLGEPMNFRAAEGVGEVRGQGPSACGTACSLKTDIRAPFPFRVRWGCGRSHRDADVMHARQPVELLEGALKSSAPGWAQARIGEDRELLAALYGVGPGCCRHELSFPR